MFYVKKQSDNYFCNYSRTILIVFSFLYLVFPLFIQPIVGENFYIYSYYQYKVTCYSLLFFVGVVLLICNLSHCISKHAYVSCPLPDKTSLKFFYWLNILYFIKMILHGIPLKLAGASREELLMSISSQLITGYGYVLLLACISLLCLKNQKYIIIFALCCLCLDIIYQGKIFSSYLIMLLMFYLDNLRIKMSMRKLLLIGLLGFSFIFTIFTLRALSSGGFFLVDVYSIFSEFMGVNATIGWGYEYNMANSPMALTNFDTILQDFYIADVGHGLALSPVAYFIGNFGNKYLFISVLFFVFIAILYGISSMIIGRYALLVFMYDYLHFMRHGPDLFLLKSITHLSFLIIILCIFQNYKNNKHKFLEY